MKNHPRSSLGAVLGLVCVFLLAPASASRATPIWDMTGHWDILYVVANYTTNLVMDITAQDPVTGAFQGVALNDPIGISAGNPIEGWSDGSQFYLYSYTTWGEALSMNGNFAADGSVFGTVIWHSFHGAWHGFFGTTSGQAAPVNAPDSGSTALFLAAALCAFATTRRLRPAR